MGHEFDSNIEVVRKAAGEFAADLASGWVVGGGVNGGNIATAAADLRQGADTRITALATYGDLGRLGDDVRTTAEEPAMPPPDQCVPNTMAPPEVRAIAPLMDRFDMRFHPDHVGWAVGRPSGNGVLSAWFRLADGRDPDPISLLMVVDALPPVTFELGMPGWAPTLELTAHVRARPAPGWLKVRHETRNMAGGKVEDSESPEAALVREIREELGCSVVVERWLGGAVAIGTTHELTVAVVRIVEGEPVPHEHDAVRWLDADELDTVDWLDPDRPFLPEVRGILA